MVDGVYDSDPKKNPEAKKYDTVSFLDVLNKTWAMMDSRRPRFAKTTISQSLFSVLNSPENIVAAVCGEDIGTLVE